MLNRRTRNRMSASFAKAVMPRVRREGEAGREPDWTLGWVFPIKTDLPPGSESQGAGVSAHGMAADVAPPPPVVDDISIKTFHD